MLGVLRGSWEMIAVRSFMDPKLCKIQGYLFEVQFASRLGFRGVQLSALSSETLDIKPDPSTPTPQNGTLYNPL